MVRLIVSSSPYGLGAGVWSETAAPASGAKDDLMDATTQAMRDVRSDNPYYRVTRWVLPAGATTGQDQDQHRATILPSATGQLLLKKQDGEQHMEAVAGQPLEIEPGVGRELFNTSEHELSFTMIEFK